MANVLNVCFLLGIFLFGFLIVATILLVALKLLGIKHQPLWLAGAFVLSVAALLIYHAYETRPAAMFEREFGFPPTADVKALESEFFVLGERGELNLSFLADKGTVQRIVTQQFGEKLGATASPTSELLHFHCDFSLDFTTESKDLYYNPRTGRVGFYWIGRD